MLERSLKRAWLIAAAIVLASTVSSGAQSAERAPSEATAVTVPAGQIDRAVSAIDGLAEDLLRKTGVPGMSIAVAHDDRIVYLKGFGVRKVGYPQRVDADTVFEIASVSKPVGASVIAGAVGEGAVKWTDPVAKYLPGFTLSNSYVGRTVTIADMYAQRSGLPDHAGDLLEDLGYGRAYILKRLSLEPLAPFRINYAYTNFGLTAAAQAVANAEHTTWENLSQRVLYGPLGMTLTSSRYADYEKAANRAAIHARVGDRWFAKYIRDADAQSPAGGVSSTARDMAQWLRFELADGKYNGKQIVSTDALLATRVPAITKGPPASPIARASFYGLGMDVAYDQAGRLRLSHSGAFALGAATSALMLPSEHLGIVVLTNGMPIGVPEALANEFLDLAEFGKIQRDWFAAYNPIMMSLYRNPSKLAGKTARPSTPAHANDAYTGRYVNRYYGAAKIVDRGGQLTLFLGPRPEAFALSRWNGDTFAYYPRGENAVGISAVTFVVGPARRATKMTVEHLNQNGLGTFVR
jgi:CubicO group peptidase (beta-lactamase class C family)